MALVAEPTTCEFFVPLETVNAGDPGVPAVHDVLAPVRVSDPVDPVETDVGLTEIVGDI